MKLIAYVRVSTQKQGQSGLGLAAQVAAIGDYARQHDAEIVATYEEVESGRKVKQRPQLAAALAHARRIKAVFVVAKLDRLARNVAFVSQIMDSGVEFVAVDNPFATRLTLHILAAVAEHEAMMIGARTKAALAAAKARGVKLGSPTAAQTAPLAAKAKTAVAQAAARNIAPIIAEIERSGVTTLQGVANALQARGIKTPGDRNIWRPVQVARIKATAAAAA